MRTMFLVVLSFMVFGFPDFRVVFAQNLPDLVQEQGFADTVLVNGKILTMDDRSTLPNTPGHIFEAMAIKGEKVMALGTNDAMQLLAGPKTQRVDAGGRTVIPGLIQTHYHLFAPAAAKYGPSMGLVDPSVKLTVMAEKTAEATVGKLKETILNAIAVQSIPKGQWITVTLQAGRETPPGMLRTWFFTRKITRRQFDTSTQGHPILISSGNSGMFNSTAIAEFKRTFPQWQESADLENGPGAADDGYIGVPEIQAVAFEYWWRDVPLEAVAETMRMLGRDVLKQGITTVATRIGIPKVIAAYHLLNRNGQMPHRLAYFVESQRGNFFDLESTREFYKGMGASWTTHASGNSTLWLNGMSNEMWDSLEKEICMGPDVPAPPEIRARERCPAPGGKAWESCKSAILAGWRPVQVHATSSHGARLYLQMLEEAMHAGDYSIAQMRNLRTTVELNYLLGAPPDVLAGLKKFGVILNASPSGMLEVPELIKDYGEKLRSFAMPVKTWIREGIRVTLAADEMEFWTPIYRLVTRQVPKSRSSSEFIELLPGEAIDRVTALKMATVWASEYVMAEDTIGTLEPGKYADFAVLDKEFLTIPTAEIPSVKVVMVGLSGNITSN